MKVRRGTGALCLNFVEGGGCHATGGKCLLGPNSASAKNRDGGCELHGTFDVWLTHKNDLLITDMGFPSEEPKQCFALGVHLTLARKIAASKMRQLRTSVITSEHRCFKCHERYWVSEHRRLTGLLEIGIGYLCPDCIGESKSVDVEERLGVLRYWCG